MKIETLGEIKKEIIRGRGIKSLKEQYLRPDKMFLPLPLCPGNNCWANNEIDVQTSNYSLKNWHAG
jgi:hypothetical protein